MWYKVMNIPHLDSTQYQLSPPPATKINLLACVFIPLANFNHLGNNYCVTNNIRNVNGLGGQKSTQPAIYEPVLSHSIDLCNSKDHTTQSLVFKPPKDLLLAVTWVQNSIFYTFITFSAISDTTTPAQTISTWHQAIFYSADLFALEVSNHFLLGLLIFILLCIVSDLFCTTGAVPPTTFHSTHFYFVFHSTMTFLHL